MKKMNQAYLLILAISLFGCEKVIDLNLTTASPVIVVDGQVTNSSTVGSIVKLSFSQKVVSDNNSIPVTGAIVTIQEDNGSIFTLNEVSNGVYHNASLVGVIGKTYHLKVISNGVILTSSSTMPVMVNLDSLVIESFPNFNKTVKVVTPYYKDPQGYGNNYNFTLYKNGRLLKDAFAYDDLFIDGKKVSFPLVYSREKDELKSGDKVDVIMNCIDHENYKYWFSFSQGSTGRPLTIPDNPISNIAGNAIGIFGAYTYQKRSVVIP